MATILCWPQLVSSYKTRQSVSVRAAWRAVYWRLIIANIWSRWELGCKLPPPSERQCTHSLSSHNTAHGFQGRCITDSNRTTMHLGYFHELTGIPPYLKQKTRNRNLKLLGEYLAMYILLCTLLYSVLFSLFSCHCRDLDFSNFRSSLHQILCAEYLSRVG